MIGIAPVTNCIKSQILQRFGNIMRRGKNNMCSQIINGTENHLEEDLKDDLVKGGLM